MNEKYEVDFCSNGWEAKALNILKSEGVVVLNNVFTYDECDKAMEQVFENFQTLSPELRDIEFVKDKWKKVKEKWVSENLPLQTRPGLFQRLLSNQKVYWEFRSDPRIHKIFKTLYSDLRGHEVDEFVTSLDGLNFKPPIAPFHSSDEKNDWAHVDQTFKGTYDCIQGQIVLSDTSAGFRASPRSHLIHEKILDDLEAEGKYDNFLKFKHDYYDTLKKQINDLGGEWQRTFRTRRGSMILWLSTTIHSAQTQEEHYSYDKYENTNQKWLGWRGVFYVCYRNKDEVDKKHIDRLQDSFENNRTTNHWGSKIFPKFPNFGTNQTFTDKITEYLNNPESVYTEIKDWKPTLSPRMSQLLGY